MARLIDKDGNEGPEMCEWCAIRLAIPAPAPEFDGIIACGLHFAEQKKRANVQVFTTTNVR